MTGTGVGFLLGAKAQVGRLCGGVDFTRQRMGLVQCNAGLQLRHIGLFAGRSPLAGNQRLGTDLRSLYTVIGIGCPRRRVNGFHYRGKNFDTAVQSIKIGLYRAADIIGQCTALLAQHAIERA